MSKKYIIHAGFWPCLAGCEIPDSSIILHASVHHIAFGRTSCNILNKIAFLTAQAQGLPSSQLDVTDIAQVSRSKEYALGRNFYRKMFFGGVPINNMSVKGARPKIHLQHNSVKSYIFIEQEISSLTKS